MKTIKLGIFDDHPIVSGGVTSFLGNYPEQITILFAANSRAILLEKLAESTPNVLILDVVAPDVNGLDLFTEISKNYAAIKIIAYTSLKSPILVENLLMVGAKGFVNKSQDPHDLLDAVEDVYNGYISVPQKYKYLTARFRETQNNLLTAREIEVIALIAQEATTQFIAEKLGISTKTVENHRSNIFHKLEVKNSAGLILAATRLGLISWV